MNSRRDQVLALKRQNLEDRIQMAGDLTQNQIVELRAQYDREFANVERAIREEKAKQIQNMRAAMLNRRIAQERKRRQKQEQEEAAKERERIEQMKAEEAKLFREELNARQGQDASGLDAIQAVGGEDILRARLAKWNSAVDEAKVIRGGEENEIWNLEAKRQAEKDEKERLKKEKEQAKLEKEKQTQFTIQELYKRILRVEKLSEIVKDQGKIDDPLNLLDVVSYSGRPMSGFGR